MLFIEVVPNRNQENLQPYLFHDFSDYSLVPTIIFYDAESAFWLDGTIHTEKRAMDTFQVIHGFLMHGRQFFIDANGSVLIRPFALCRIRVVNTVFALIYFLLTSVQISFDILSIFEI